MGVLGGQYKERARLHQFALRFESFTETVSVAPSQHGHDLCIGMGVRWNAIVGRELHALDNYFGLRRVANQDRGFGTFEERMVDPIAVLAPLKNGWSTQVTSSTLTTLRAVCGKAEPAKASTATKVRSFFM